MNRLKELRKEYSITQNKIAHDLEMSQHGYSKLETEKNDMNTTFLKKVANYFNVSIDYILCLTENRKPYPKSKIYETSKNMNRLKEIREDNDLTQWVIIKLLGMSQSGYSQYESCINDIPVKILKTLALYYNVSVDYLLYLTDDRTVHQRKQKL